MGIFIHFAMSKSVTQEEWTKAYVRGLAEELSNDRKAIALVIKNDNFSDFGFRCLNSEKLTAGDLLFKFKSPHEESRLLRLF